MEGCSEGLSDLPKIIQIGKKLVSQTGIHVF